ncbi:type I-MYXAN CRISPR-associated Cas8a1/Cmx1 [Nitrospira moscoviensis]|nr:type I-MYXAN CRISPR-associated Cas8a1/Cmx1 [Nitrospira moscoviensis]
MAKVKSDQPKEIVLDLFSPGMTALHRVGLAGLWMTLKRFEAEKVKIPGGSWDLTDHSVTLNWKDNARLFFDGLFKQSFRIDKNGVIYFSALGDSFSYLQAAVLLHKAMLGTFLQHGKTRKGDPANKPTGALSVEVDDIALTLRYQKIKSYTHQAASIELVNEDGDPRVVRLAGWHFPGGIVRHVGLGESSTALEEPPERSIPLLYAPVGGIYFQIKRFSAGARPLYALVVPEITNLEQYAKARTVFLHHGVKELLASGTADAGWRVLATIHAKGLLHSLTAPTCRVISFGTVAWSKQQKTRVDLYTVRAHHEDRLRVYRLCLQVFLPRLVKPSNGEPFWDVPQVPDLIARNLNGGCPWYERFSDFVADQDVRKHVFQYEREGLNKMITEAGFDEERERIFVHACHEAWRRRLGQLGERARRERASFTDLTSREYERVRVGFARCKNATTLRETVTDFWARAGGPLRDLQAGWKEVLPLFDERNWRKAKDLALLALASYQPATREEAEALVSPGVDHTEGGDAQ